MIAALRRFYRGETSWDILRLSRKVLLGSAAAVLVCVVALFVRGLNLGIEFEGGSVWEIPIDVGEQEDPEGPESEEGEADPDDPADAGSQDGNEGDEGEAGSAGQDDPSSPADQSGPDGQPVTEGDQSGDQDQSISVEVPIDEPGLLEDVEDESPSADADGTSPDADAVSEDSADSGTDSGTATDADSDAADDVGDAGIDVPTTDEIAAAAAAAGVPDARVQYVAVTGSADIFRVRGVLAPGTDAATVTASLADAAGVPVESLSSRQVSPSFGDEVAGKARRALVVFFVLIALYLWFRFEWKMSIGALAAVGHDIVLTVGAYAVFGFEVTPATVVAFLTIMGYSLYDTIVVFDRVKSNEKSLPARSHFTYPALANVSLNQVLTRSVNTSITSVLPVLSLLLVGAGLLGAGTLSEFSTALLIGLLVGSYSSIFVAMPAVAWLKGYEPGWAVARAASDAAGRHDSLEAATQALAAQSYTRRAPPRPRKRNRNRTKPKPPSRR